MHDMRRGALDIVDTHRQRTAVRAHVVQGRLEHVGKPRGIAGERDEQPGAEQPCPKRRRGIERNEVSGRTTDLSAIQSVRPDWLKPGGGYRLLVQYGRLTRHPNFPDVPTARELASTDAGRALIEFTETPLLTMARPYAAPPGVPADRAKALQDAFLAAHRDPQFLAEAAKLGIYISPVSAQETSASIERMAQAPRSLFEQVSKILGKGG